MHFAVYPQIKSGDVVRAPFAKVPIAAIDPHDIAAVAIADLIGDLAPASGITEGLLALDSVSERLVLPEGARQGSAFSCTPSGGCNIFPKARQFPSSPSTAHNARCF